MANRIFISTDNIKTLIKQWQNNEQRKYIAEYTPKDSKDTLVLVSELKQNYEPKGYLLYWANKNTLEKSTTDKMEQELMEQGLPF